MREHIDISIVIPAFNESKRLPLFLDRVLAYCQKTDKIFEIIVVDDGSPDATFDIANSYNSKFEHLHVIKNEQNIGKGYSVKTGILSAIGDVQVFIDADGSTAPEEISRNLHYLEEGYDILIGSRVLKNEAQVLKTRWHRKFMGTIFNFCVRTFLFGDIKDTQCGFKMFKKEVIEPLFSRVKLRRFGFDIEFLYLAHKMGYKIKEEAVSWHHVTGSKVNVFKDSIEMFINILQIRIWHSTQKRIKY